MTYTDKNNVVKIGEKSLYMGFEKMILNITLNKRVARNWTHYDVEVEHDGSMLIEHRSACYGVYSPPYPAHWNEEKMDKEIDINELCKRIFLHDRYSNKFILCHGVDTEVEIGKIKLKK